MILQRKINTLFDKVVVNPYDSDMTSTTKENRILHLVDLENLSGGSLCSPTGVASTASDYLALVPQTGKELYVLATSCGNAPVAFFSWPTPAQRLMRSGENGADLALLEAYTALEIASRFAQVVIGSGDGIFTDLTLQLCSLGCTVIVVSRSDALSQRLQMAATEVVLLPELASHEEALRAA